MTRSFGSWRKPKFGDGLGGEDGWLSASSAPGLFGGGRSKIGDHDIGSMKN